MNTNMQIFNNPAFGSVRVVEIDGEPWLVGKDVATALGYSNPRDALRVHVDDEDKNTVVIHDGIPGNPNMTVINESGVYSLVMSSKLPDAKKFRRWVTSEVLPAIRKTGGYIHGAKDMTDMEIVSKAFLISQRTIEERNAEIKRLETTVQAQREEIAAFEPVRSYVNDILSSERTMTTTQIAADYGISARELNRILHAEHIQWKTNGQWVLYKEHMNKGYTKSVTVQITHSDGKPDAILHTQWTQKGRLMIHGILTRRGIRANMDVEVTA